MDNELYVDGWKRKSLKSAYPDKVKEYIAEINLIVAYNEALNTMAVQGHCVEYVLDEAGDKYMKEHFIYKKDGK